MDTGYRIYMGNSLIGETVQKQYKVGGLSPCYKYSFSVSAFNGVREGKRVPISIVTRQLNFVIPNVTLPIGKIINFYYQEYSLGLVPLGEEPAGMFGGGNTEKIYAKVISNANGKSIFLPRKTVKGFDDLTVLKKQPDGTFAAFSDYKAIYYVP
jgi:hypothetical protein